ncbi:MAG: hypothetical protein JNM43_02165 [Planctomycetaceae bacterium]|nr:hypothetical protein [Planctomycetaceae bacterium]
MLTGILRAVAMTVVLGFAVRTTGADEKVAFPQRVPPMFGTAINGQPTADSDASEWVVTVTVPRARWKVVGEVIPKEKWPELSVSVEKATLTLKMGGPSQLSESQFLNLEGNEISRKEVTERLKKETPVLIAVDGRVPEPYYLELLRPETIVVVLSPREGTPRADLLPAAKP